MSNFECAVWRSGVDMEGKKKRGGGECHELADLSAARQTVKIVH